MTKAPGSKPASAPADRQKQRRGRGAPQPREEDLIYRKVVEFAPDAILVQHDGRITCVNPRAVALSGAESAADLLGRTTLELVVPAQRSALAACIEALKRAGDGTGPLEHDILRLDGTTFTGEVRAVAISGGDRPIVQALVRDITEPKRAEAKIWHLAHHDALTGLPNRTLFTDRLQQALLARPVGSKVAVLCLDLSGFKAVNDALGRAVGDALLCHVAERLRANAGEQDLVARLDGDEFAVIRTEAEGSEGSPFLAERLIDALGRPFLVGAHEAHIGACIGIARGPDHGSDPDALLRQAEIARARAKEAGGGSYRVFQPTMHQRLQLRREIERDVRQGLEREEFSLAYQPQFDLWTGEIVSIEALLRWAHPTHGSIPPDAFIPIAEEVGLILPLGEWVLRHACAQARRWHDQGLPAARIAVNLSAAQFALADIAAVIERTLDEVGLPPSRLELEITEAILMREVDETIATLRRLHAQGITLSVDDFGTGYSSLTHLKRFPLDKLKIDRFFVRDVPGDPDGAAIARAVITLAHALQLKVSAEGVESAAAVAFLKAEGCDEAQGFHLSCPVDAECCGELLLRLGQGQLADQLAAAGIGRPAGSAVVPLRPRQTRLHRQA